MNKRKLLSIVLAALIALDVVCFSTVFAYHLCACENNASISVDEVAAPTGNFTEDVVIIAPSYDSGHYISFPMHPDYTENWLFIRRQRAIVDFGDNQNVEPMTFTNMFPGDSVSKSYVITLTHKYQVDVEFTVENIITTPEGDATPLSDVLSMRVYINGYDTPAYDGLIRDFTSVVTRLEEYREVVDNILEYTIEVYLPTSAGNDYMQNGLKCDFVWTVYEDDKALDTDIIPIPPDDWPWPEEPDPDPEPDPEWPEPGPGDEDEVEIPEPEEGITEFEGFDYVPAPCHLAEYAAIMAILLVALVAALVAVRRKEANHEEN